MVSCDRYNAAIAPRVKPILRNTAVCVRRLCTQLFIATQIAKHESTTVTRRLSPKKRSARSSDTRTSRRESRTDCNS